ncbi:MAG: BRO family protein [Chlorobium sp.]
MKPEVIQSLTTTFESCVQKTENGVEYWLARDLQHLLGYGEWRNFSAVISKAKTACEVSDHAATDHFVDVNKTISMPKTAEKEVLDIILIRYACYLIAQNGDPRKQEIAFAQTYFAVQTRLKVLANERDVPYQSLLKMFLKERLDQEFQ